MPKALIGSDCEPDAVPGTAPALVVVSTSSETDQPVFKPRTNQPRVRTPVANIVSPRTRSQRRKFITGVCMTSAERAGFPDVTRRQTFQAKEQQADSQHAVDTEQSSATNESAMTRPSQPRAACSSSLRQLETECCTSRCRCTRPLQRPSCLLPAVA